MVARAATHPFDELHESYDGVVWLRELRLILLMSCMNLVASAAGLLYESPTTLEVQDVGRWMTAGCLHAIPAGDAGERRVRPADMA